MKWLYLFTRTYFTSRLDLMETYTEINEMLRVEKETGYKPFRAWENPNDTAIDKIAMIKPEGYVMSIICHQKTTPE